VGLPYVALLKPAHERPPETLVTGHAWANGTVSGQNAAWEQGSSGRSL